MRFRLLIEGPIPPRKQATLAQIHAIRRRLHHQMQRLWRHAPLQDKQHWLRLTPPVPNDIAILEDRAGRHFAPLISQKNATHCSLNVVFLKSEYPNTLISVRGDIDNRLKTLFDALRVPSVSEIQQVEPVAQEGENPLYCVMQDDGLITGLSVETDRLLTSDGQHDVFAVATITLHGSRLTWTELLMGVAVSRNRFFVLPPS